ncbi:hypothetical protein pEaSNUABM17_00084 [Erwinia phage pEa_SNUABM_17]|uniref:Uncharacterized protein n=1 Tax=Erwinia phage pEa_SNUABM_17 TaxID=2869545 RepID=A0AAE7XLG4_9CAUD|nr:hypothetical protein MPK72_gp084 [Erwinia phage pEa_SNUABM_17]QZE57630.1 hypothetical protein pEaSNUABM17_00084 [Erwinia phage pEa_SNUABM_17]
MFVPVIAYDPDLFADFVFVLSQIEISSDSQPYKRSTAEGISTTTRQRLTDADQLNLVTYSRAQIKAQQVNMVDQIVLVGALATQVQSKFTPRTFASNLAAPRIDAPLVTGSFVTDQTIEPLYDNIVFRVSVPALDLSDTKANNKSVAPVVS